MSVNVKWLAQSTIYRDSIDLLGVHDYGDHRDVFQPVVFEAKRQDRQGVISEPTIALSPQSARSLMQALWDAGIRPDDPSLGSPAEVAALKGHIKYAEGVTGALLERMPVLSAKDQ